METFKKVMLIAKADGPQKAARKPVDIEVLKAARLILGQQDQALVDAAAKRAEENGDFDRPPVIGWL